MNLIHLYAVVSEPFIPTTSAAMRAAFTLEDDTAAWVTQAEAKALTTVPSGTLFTVSPVLFAKLTDDDLAAYKERFGGEPV